jgi:hypothetical protein
MFLRRRTYSGTGSEKMALAAASFTIVFARRLENAPASGGGNVLPVINIASRLGKRLHVGII